MKCLAGIYSADAGEMWLRGRMAPFIELGVGFNPDLTAHDNVLLNAVMLGLTPEQADARYDAIIDFAELREFQDLKLKNYSSGMQVRLAFAVMVHVDADLLLIDEVLAVGDASFQQKCYDVLHQAKRDGRTILLVTHDMDQVQRFCDRAMLLERGDAGRARRRARRGAAVHRAELRAAARARRAGPRHRGRAPGRRGGRGDDRRVLAAGRRGRSDRDARAGGSRSRCACACASWPRPTTPSSSFDAPRRGRPRVFGASRSGTSAAGRRSSRGRGRSTSR